MRQLKKAASLLLACVLLLGLLPQQALAAEKLTLTYLPQGENLLLGLKGLDGDKVAYGVQVELTLEGQLDTSNIQLTPADQLAFSPDHATSVDTEGKDTKLTVYLVSAYALNNNSTLVLGTLKGEGQQLKLKSAQVGLVYSEDFSSVGQGQTNQVTMNTASIIEGTVDTPSGGNNNNTGGGGGGGSVSGTSYEIKTTQGAHGSFSVSPQSARQGQVVTITLKPDAGYQLESLTVVDTTSSKIAVAGSGNRYTFRMPAAQVAVTAVFREIDPENKPGNTPTSFSDVSTEDWFYDAVQYVCGKGMMNGMGDGSFAPYTTTSRGMIVTILYRLENQPQAAASSFTDVATGQWYTDAVSWASANGIVTGYGEQRAGQFGPEDPITRQQMAAILMRYAKYKGYDISAQGQLSSFADQADIESYAVEAMQWANGAGLITGVTETTLVPTGNANRAQAATILMRFCETIAQ